MESKHCEYHTDIAISCSQIAEMKEQISEIHNDVKEMRTELSDAIAKANEELVKTSKTVAVHEKLFDVGRRIAGVIVAVEVALIIALISTIMR